MTKVPIIDKIYSKKKRQELILHLWRGRSLKLNSDVELSILFFVYWQLLQRLTCKYSLFGILPAKKIN